MRSSLLFACGLFSGFTLHYSSCSSSFCDSNTSFRNRGRNEPEAGTDVDINSAIPRPPVDSFTFQNVGWYKENRKVFSAKFRNYILSDVIPLTPDVSLFRFLLPHEDDEFNLKPCSTLQARVTFRGGGPDEIYRFYTPVTANGTKSYFDIIVKRQRNGRMTNHLWKMKIGESLQFRNVLFKLRYRPNRWDEVGMIAGGTGFSPMLQIINHALKPKVDPMLLTDVANRTMLESGDENMKRRSTNSSAYFKMKNEQGQSQKEIQEEEKEKESRASEKRQSRSSNDTEEQSLVIGQGRHCQSLTIAETARRFIRTRQEEEFFAETGDLWNLNDELQSVLGPYLPPDKDKEEIAAEEERNRNNASPVIFDSHFFRPGKASRVEYEKTLKLQQKSDEGDDEEVAKNHEDSNPQRQQQQTIFSDQMEQMSGDRVDDDDENVVSGSTLGAFSSELVEPTTTNTSEKNDTNPDRQQEQKPLGIPSPTPSKPVSSLPSSMTSKKNKSKKPPQEEVIDRTKISFLFCNRTEHHILLKPLFEQLQRDYPERFRVKFCVDFATDPENWDGYTGYVSEQMIKETMPAPDKRRSIILLCGPDHLLEHLAGTSLYLLGQMSKGRPIQPAAPDLANKQRVSGLLGKMGYTTENVYKF